MPVELLRTRFYILPGAHSSRDGSKTGVSLGHGKNSGSSKMQRINAVQSLGFGRKPKLIPSQTFSIGGVGSVGKVGTEGGGMNLSHVVRSPRTQPSLSTKISLNPSHSRTTPLINCRKNWAKMSKFKHFFFEITKNIPDTVRIGNTIRGWDEEKFQLENDTNLWWLVHHQLPPKCWRIRPTAQKLISSLLYGF